MRNLTKTLVAVSLLVPASAFPLGIGEIKLHSALNQNLDAEIALLISADENLAEVKVRLAPPEKFDEAGVPWSYFLSKIKFESVTLPNGSAIVKLSSKEALREPFLDFLLEVTWDKGSLYREFTVLVDPPAAYTQPIIPVIQKVEQVETVIKEQKATESVEDEIVSDERVADSEYGPTTRTDSLWAIAENVNAYGDVSIEQMMMAIYNANQRAFYKDNVNALMAGKTLSIPEKEIIVKLSQQQALSVFRRQDKEWKGRVSAKQTAQKPAVEVVEVKTQLELEAPVEAEVTEMVTVVSDNEIVTDVAPVEKTQASLVSSDDASVALQARMETLEQQLLMMQKMLVLKDEQIAALQHKQLAKVSETINTDKKLETVDVKQVDIKVEQTPIKDAVDKAPPKPVAKPTPTVKPKPVVKPELVDQPEPDFMVGKFPLIAGGLGVGVLGLLGWLFWRKRKIEDETDDESMFASASEIILPDSDSSIEDELTTPMMDDASYDVGTVGESSFLSEFTPSDFDAFDTDQNEVDPISEADVYLAYGRYQQAEDLMRQAIIDQPERDECKLKLLEIFYANENKVAFEKYATELVGEGKHNDTDFWSKIAEMGGELDPSSRLFSTSGGDADLASFETASDKAPTEVNAEATVDNLPSETQYAAEENDFDLSIFDNEASEDAADTEENTDALDFDLSVFDFDDSDDDQKQAIESTTDEVESVDFDLNSAVSDEGEEKSAEDSSGTDEIESFDFDSSDLSVEKPEQKAEEITAIDLESDTEEGLDSFDFSLNESPTEVEEKKQQSQPVAADDGFDDFDFDFEIDASPSSSTEEATDVSSLGVSDLTDMDELETKIDLAKAYVDMGDIDAAKAIAEEVLEKGSAEQKEAAQEVLDKLK